MEGSMIWIFEVDVGRDRGAIAQDCEGTRGLWRWVLTQLDHRPWSKNTVPHQDDGHRKNGNTSDQCRKSLDWVLPNHKSMHVKVYYKNCVDCG